MSALEIECSLVDIPDNTSIGTCSLHTVEIDVLGSSLCTSQGTGENPVLGGSNGGNHRRGNGSRLCGSSGSSRSSRSSSRGFGTSLLLVSSDIVLVVDLGPSDPFRDFVP